MTSAESVFNPDPDSLVRKANWLGRYLEVEKSYDRKLRVVLNDALKDIDTVMDRVGDDVAGQVRRAQLRLAQKAIRRNLDTVFSKTGDLIRNGRADAAVAAIDATLFDQRSIFATLFPDPIDRRNYADSLRQTAQRNIESVVTRVLFTEQPLSRRVYKTKALANGMVNKVINRGLSRGDSAANIASNVRSLISPNVPGGISYAAMRLGRTEINNAFHAQSIHDAQELPWINQMRWHLSKVHAEDPGDPCEFYSLTGLFDIEHVPPKPHPNCRCYVTAELPDHDAFMEDVIQGKYDRYLDDVMARGGMTSTAPVKDEAVISTKPVKWDGPPVAKPTTSPKVQSSIAYDWKMPTFDENKQYLREGVRDVEINGYQGLSPSQLSRLRKQIDQIPEFPNGPIQNEVAQEALRAEGREIAATAVHSAPTEQPLFRGLSLTPDEFDKLKPGSKLSMPVSSFTDSKTTAYGFAGDPRWVSWTSVDPRDIPLDAKSVVLQLEPGAKVAKIPDLHGASDEWAGFGKFEIVDISPGGTLTEEVGPYIQTVVDGKRVYVGTQKTWVEPTIVKIRQTSMVEQFNAAKEATVLTDQQQANMAQAFAGFNKELNDKITQVQQIKAALADRYSRRTTFYGMDGERFVVDPRVAQEFSDTYEELADKYYSATPTRIGFGDAEFAYAETMPLGRRRFGGYDSRVTFSDFFSQDYDSLKEAMAENVAKGFHAPGADENPVRGIITHEWGHSMANSILGDEDYTPNGGIGYNEILTALQNKYDQLKPDLDFVEWYKSGLTEYSFINYKTGFIDSTEAIAEAFDECERLGDKASEPAKVIYKLLLDKYNSRFG